MKLTVRRWYDCKGKFFGLYKCRMHPGMPSEAKCPEMPPGKTESSRRSCAKSFKTTVEDTSDGEDHGASDNEDEDFRSAKCIAISTGYGDSALLPRACECAVPVAGPADFDEDMEFIVDSGADFDILNLKHGMKLVKRYVRDASRKRRGGAES